jgi:hypothetical protein
MADLDHDPSISSPLSDENHKVYSGQEALTEEPVPTDHTEDSVATPLNREEEGDKHPDTQSPNSTVDHAPIVRPPSTQGISAPKRFNAMNIHKKFLEKTGSVAQTSSPSTVSKSGGPARKSCQALLFYYSSKLTAA